jgi:hypothetical protein
MQSIFAILRKMTSDVPVKFTEKGMVIYALDDREICIAHIEISAEEIGQCGTYECPKPCVAGVSVSDMQSALQSAKPNDMLTIELVRDPAVERVLRVWITNDRGTACFYDVNVLDMDEEIMQFPKTNDEYTIVSMQSVVVQRRCKSALSVRDAQVCVLYCTPENLIIQTVNDMGKVSVNVPIDAGRMSPTQNQDIVDSPYSMRFISLALRAYKITRSISFKICPGHPLVLEYKVPFLGALRMFIAPEPQTLSENQKKQHLDMIRVRQGGDLPAADEDRIKQTIQRHMTKK